jgi:hypothetical protein
MNVTDLTLERAKALATRHYNTWGGRVIEGMNDAELTASLEKESTLADWIETQKMRQSHREDIQGEREDYSDDRAWEDDGGIEIDREAYRRMIS